MHVAASKSQRQKHADKLQHLRQKTTRIASGSAVVQPHVNSSKPLETIKAARSPSPKWQPVGDDGMSSVSNRHDLNTDRQEVGSNGQKARNKIATNSKASSIKGDHVKNQKGTKSDPSHSKAGGRQRNSTNEQHGKTSINKAAGNFSAKSEHKPAAVEAAGISLFTRAYRLLILCLVYVNLPGIIG